ncbi:hypothetical protein ACMVR0_001277 [Yersinia enterocolitica]
MDKHTIAHLKTVMSTDQLIDFLADQLAAAELEMIKPLPIGELIHRLEGQTYRKWYDDDELNKWRERAEAAEARLLVPVKLSLSTVISRAHAVERIIAAGYPVERGE